MLPRWHGREMNKYNPTMISYVTKDHIHSNTYNIVVVKVTIFFSSLVLWMFEIHIGVS